MKTRLFFLSVLLCVFSYTNAQNIKYVDANATGNNDGTSWANAYTNLQSAIDIAPATLTSTSNYQIWVKAGTHTPGTSRNSFYNINKSRIKLYGGFNGTETQLSQRNPTANPTILSGDLNGNDSGTPSLSNTSRSENAYRVVEINVPNIILDGFTISGGQANGTSYLTNRGAGLTIGNNSASNINIINCVIENNVASSLGAGVMLDKNRNGGAFGNFKFDRCIFRKNVAPLGSVFFIRQILPAGSAHSNAPRVTLINSLIEENTVTAGYGGIININNRDVNSSTINVFASLYVRNSTFVKNIDNNSGGAVIVGGIIGTGGPTRVSLENSIFHQNTSLGNTMPAYSKGYYDSGSRVSASHSQDDDNFSEVPQANITNVIDTNPLFTDFNNGDYTLQDASPCKDTGNNGLDYGTMDLAGNAREINAYVDMGAYENNTICEINTIDANFKNAILAHGNTITGTNISTIDTNGDGKIQCLEASLYEGLLSIKNKNITDLTGLESFTKLTELECQDNQLTSLNVSQNTALTKLYCFRNLLTALDVSQNTNLEQLACSFNQIKDIDVSANSNLKRLYVQNNDLSSCNVKNGNNGIITKFDARNNASLTCIEVDNTAYSTTNWTNIDSQTSFNTTCATASVDDLETSKFKIYPNPVTNYVTIETQEKVAKIEIFDLKGRKLSTSTTKSIDLSSYASGIYLLKITGKENKTLTQKIIKK